jgi:DNA (cytosine-5)-methyltransferase 1
MILDIVKKSANTTIERYYILTTYKLEIIANGIVNTLKYYLRC